MSIENSMADNETLFCYKHPNRETLLRCNKCNRPICSECAVLTPTGYRCKECVRGQQKIFDNAQAGDFIISVVAAVGLSYFGSYLPSFIGFFTIFAAPFIGMVIVEIIRKLTHNHRSRSLFTATTVATVLGSLPMLFSHILSLTIGLQAGAFNMYALLPLIWQAAFTILVSGSVYYRMTGIRIG
jgi:hypothetical protein